MTSKLFKAIALGALLGGVPFAALAVPEIVADEASVEAAFGPPVPTPQVIRSRKGKLDVTLTAQPSLVTVAGKTFASNVYNGTYVPPVLRAKRGDNIHVRLVNRIGDNPTIDTEGLEPQMSNLHYHGMAIPPKLPGDFIYMLVPPGTTKDQSASGHAGHSMQVATGGVAAARSVPGFGAGMQVASANVYDYRFKVPSDHAQGVFWYHPHPHGISEDQVLGGLSGLLVIEGLIERHYTELSRAPRRNFLFKDIALPGSPDGAAKTKTINGVSRGTITSRPGRFEVWELGNIGADSYFDLTIGNRKFWVIERDGNPLVKPQQVDHVFLPPSSRATIVLEVPPKGNYPIRTQKVATGSAGDPNPTITLATLVSTGKAESHPRLVARMSKPPSNIATLGPTPAEVKALPVTGKRTITYTENAAGTKFYLNGKAFDMTRIDAQVKLGDVEEWTLVNNTDERHTFHIHQLDFLVQKVTGKGTLEQTGILRDNVDIPYRDPVTKEPGTVTVKIPFTNPLIVGMFPFHCHILEHEDGGMMATMLVTR